MKSSHNKAERRINIKRFSWQEFLAIWIIMLCLTGGQAMIFYSFTELSSISVPISFILANMGYWALMTLCICGVTALMRRRTLVLPMEKMGEAAKQVAQGDFSVYLAPLRKDGKKDDIELMFDNFNKMVEQLGSIETLQNDFIANVSHEIKTPLAVIENYATALQTTNLTDRMNKDYTDTIIAASQKLGSLVTNILKLNKLEHQEIAPVLEEFDLCAELCECALGFEELWEEKRITFTANMDDRAVITSDKSMLAIVWNNLLSNALKFTEAGGAVTLTQTSDSDTVTVMISDTGCGMDDETMKRIFDKFYQGDASHAQEGNGLGLALALRAIEILGGQIKVKSTPGKGTTFQVDLKVAPEQHHTMTKSCSDE